jgi:hypothetical protein
MQILVQPNGGVRCIYDEAIDLSSLGRLQIKRGSHVEPDDGLCSTGVSRRNDLKPHRPVFVGGDLLPSARGATPFCRQPC